MKYIKRPCEIDAIQWDGTFFGSCKIESEFPEMQTIAKNYNIDRDECTYWEIGTLEGGHCVSKFDYIIKGIKGEFYPCKPDIFELSYTRSYNES